MKDISDKISTTLKALRKAKGWSLDKASLETGVSKAMLGQIERGESSPTIATLWKIAKGFHTSFSSFIDETNLQPTGPIHRQGNPKQLHPEDTKIRVMPIFSFDPTLKFEVFIIELLPGCEHMSPAHDDNVVEHVIVADGHVEIYINDKWHRLKKGEGLQFAANQIHGYRNTSNAIACIHDIIHY